MKEKEIKEKEKRVLQDLKANTLLILKDLVIFSFCVSFKFRGFTPDRI